MNRQPSGYFTSREAVGATMKACVLRGATHPWGLPSSGERLHLLEGCCRPILKPIPTSTTGT